MPTANESIRDDLVVREVQLRRFIGGRQRASLEIQRQLERDVLAALESFGDLDNPANMARFMKRVKELSTAAYKQQNQIATRYLKDSARTESEAVVVAVSDALEDSLDAGT